MINTSLKSILAVTSGLLLTLSCLILALWLAWLALSPVGFGYNVAYDTMNIEKHIKRYGPKNRYKSQFETTSPDQHKQLFQEIVNAIKDGGNGLSTIQYQPDKGPSIALLRNPEVVHLQDVANLVALFDYAGFACLALFIVMVLLYRWRNQKPPSLMQMGLGTLAVLVVTGAIVLMMGATKVFYWLHVQIFPDDHQWFFYYQESLMTTLMKAPDLFGFITALWIGLALLFFAVLLLGMFRILRPTTR